jgi:dynein heavy chain
MTIIDRNLLFYFLVGGRVTDDWDRRCVMNVLDDFYASKILDPNYCYDESQIYHQLPPISEHQAYVAYVRSLPINDTPEIFGLHDNANSKFQNQNDFERKKHENFLF